MRLFRDPDAAVATWDFLRALSIVNAAMTVWIIWGVLVAAGAVRLWQLVM
ncbi:MAG TPA: hypothetical protein VNN07_06465 [Candidatus Tectomicrobia bacterium]|nr:hypothetical protein [Candidatus Tectomicrobia bacterium]